MCRWFAYISPSEPCLIEDVLIAPEHSLCKQVNENYLPGLLGSRHQTSKEEQEAILRNRYLNIDGFGLVYYNSTRSEFTPASGDWPVVYKCAKPPLRDPNFRSLAANTSTLTLFGHIRASSSAPVVVVNNHPFVFGRQSVMHNGSIGEFAKIRLKMVAQLEEDAYAAINGGTDSEHFAALYITYLCRNAKEKTNDQPRGWEDHYSPEDMKAALIRTLETLFELQISVLGADAPGNSLNVCVTDGRSMVAIRVRNHKLEDPPSLYFSTTAGTSLNRRFSGTADGGKNTQWAPNLSWTKEDSEHGWHFICASEPSTKEAAQWTLIPKNHCVLVGPEGAARVETMGFKDSLNATKITTMGGDFGAHINGPHDRYGNRLHA